MKVKFERLFTTPTGSNGDLVKWHIMMESVPRKGEQIDLIYPDGTDDCVAVFRVDEVVYRLSSNLGEIIIWSKEECKNKEDVERSAAMFRRDLKAAGILE